MSPSSSIVGLLKDVQLLASRILTGVAERFLYRFVVTILCAGQMSNPCVVHSLQRDPKRL